MFVDVHCHLDSNYYNDIDKIIDNAKMNNVNRLIFNGCNKKSNNVVIDLINKYDSVYGAVGYHPTELDLVCDSDYDLLEDLIRNKKIVAIGEIGLDYHYPDTDKDRQKYAFRRQLEIAEKYNLPVIIHSRDAIMDTYNIICEYNIKGVIHCFSGSVEMARKFIQRGFFISIGGIVTFKNANNIIKVINDIDLSYILLETDSPYLTPEPFRKNVNEPMYIPVIASKIASIKGISVDEVRDRTTCNSCELFDFFRKK